MAKKTQVLILHIKNHTNKGPEINLIPMGTFFIADFLNNKSIKTQIIHETIEKDLNKKFPLTAYIKKINPQFCCIPINWHQQMASAIKITREIKNNFPNIKIVTGGFTASYFAEKILKEYPFFDFAIRGDAELPLYKLIKSNPLPTIPNLIWRKNSKIITNKLTYQITPTDLNKASFTNFKLLKNYKEYLKTRMNSHSSKNENIFYFSAGRGCNGNCLNCAGGRLAQQKFNNRKTVIIYPIPFVIAQLKNLKKYNINTWISCFDPNPYSDYYIKLFREIRRNKINLTHHFDCFGLPSEEFIDEFKTTFKSESALNISPETGSERLRKKIKSFFYTNKELLKTVDYIISKDIHCSIYFSNIQSLKPTAYDSIQTKKLIKNLRNISPEIKIYNQKVDLEPGSLLFSKS